MRTPEETKAYLKHRTFDAKDLAVLRYFVESQPRLADNERGGGL